MKKEVRKLLNVLNHVMREWKQNIGAENNAVRMVKGQLENFYEKIGKNPKNPREFNTRLKLTEDQQEELEQIAFSAVEQDIYYEDWQPLFSENTNIEDEEKGIQTFESLRGQYGIDTYQDFIDFYESMNRFKNDRYLTSIMTSDQYAELVNFAEENGLTEDYVREAAIFEYSLSGSTGGDLYDFIYQSIT